MNLYVSTGPELPYGIMSSAMARTPYGNGVILVGGLSSSGILDTVIELEADGQGWVGAWKMRSTKLQHPRWSHIIIPVVFNKNINCTN